MNPIDQDIIVTLDLVPEQMVAAGCEHAQSNIRLIVYDENNIEVGKANAYGRSRPSVNVHLNSSGWYQVFIYSFDALDFDFNLHIYARE